MNALPIEHIDPNAALRMLSDMHLIRAYEEKLALLFKLGNLPMSCSSQGQEASAVGVIHALGVDDRILTNHRSAAHLLARGADPARMFAEVMGRASGYCRGRSGSLHISVKELGVVLTSTIVGGELSLAPGVALAKKQLGEAGRVVCFFGDGAATEGIFHESLNLAALWNLPVLYVCENNQWQAFVHRRETMHGDHISAWGAAYGIENCTVDGNDVEAVHAATHHALQVMQRTGKPYLLETWTYRQKGHYSADDQGHVAPDELQFWLARDPIQRCEVALRKTGVLSDAQSVAMQAEVGALIERAVEFASQAPFPDVETLTDDVYA